MIELAGQVRYQLLLLVRTPRALLAGLLLPLLLLVLRGDRNARPGLEISLIAGLAVLGVISVAYLTHATGLVSAREDGVLRRWRATPLPRWCFFAARILAAVLLSVAGTVVIVLAGVAFYGVHLPVAAAADLLGVIVLGAVSWAAIGTAVSTVIPNAESAQPLLALTFYPVILLSGVFGPLNDQPEWLVSMVRYLPARPVIDAATKALQSRSGVLSATDLTVLIGWTVAGLVASVCFFRWSPRR
jgi:ABC-2 type transport system permease protein